MIWYVPGELQSLGIDPSLYSRYRDRFIKEGLARRAFPDNPRSAIYWHPVAVEFLLFRVGKQGRPFYQYTDEELTKAKEVWDTTHTYIAVGESLGIDAHTAKIVVERGLLDDERKDRAVTRNKRKQSTGRILLAKLNTPPPYNVGDEVDCEIGFKGYTKMDLFGKVSSVTDDRVNVVIGHMETAVTFMLDGWEYEVVIK